MKSISAAHPSEIFSSPNFGFSSVEIAVEKIRVFVSKLKKDKFELYFEEKKTTIFLMKKHNQIMYQ